MKTLLNAPDGRVLGVNRRALDFLPFRLVANVPDAIIALQRGGAAPQVAMTINGEGPAQIVSFAAEMIGQQKLSLAIQEGDIVRGLMNGQIHARTIFGDSGRTPYPLPEPLYIDELRRLYLNITDLNETEEPSIRPSASAIKATSVESDPTLIEARKRQNSQQFLTLPYWYTTDDGPIILTGTDEVEKTIIIGNDHHFMLKQLSAYSDAGFLVNIVDAATNESLVQAPLGNNYLVLSRILFGDGNYPYCFRTGRLFETGHKIVVRLRNIVDGTNFVYLTLGGQAVSLKMWK